MAPPRATVGPAWVSLFHSLAKVPLLPSQRLQGTAPKNQRNLKLKTECERHDNRVLTPLQSQPRFSLQTTEAMPKRGMPMNPRGLIAFLVVVCGELSVLTFPCGAQTLSTPTTPTQALLSQQLGTQLLLPNIGGAAAAGTAVISPLTPIPSTTMAAPTQMAPGSAGRGLPGMPGGPPLNGPLGAQDPSSSYMRPPLIGPLECDLIVDPTCL